MKRRECEVKPIMMMHMLSAFKANTADVHVIDVRLGHLTFEGRENKNPHLAPTLFIFLLLMQTQQIGA